MLRPATFFTIGIGLVALPSEADAQGRLYVEASRVTFDIGRDFDDSIVLTTANETFNIPSLTEVDGIGIEVGKMHDGGAWSFAYLRADPFAPSILGDTIAQFRSYGFEAMVFPYLKSVGRFNISPTIRFGVGLTSIKIPGSATNGATLDDATYRSLGLSIGGGAIIRITGVLHIVADITRRFVGFEKVSGLGLDLDINGSVDATADYIKIGVALYLP